jgi:hypothetical protein
MNKRVVLFEGGLKKSQEKNLRLDDEELEGNYQEFIKEKNLFLFNHIFSNDESIKKSNSDF